MNTQAGGGHSVAVVGEVERDRGQDHPLLDPIQGRVQEGPEHRPLPRHPRVAAVERVHHRADDEGEPGEGQMPSDDQDHSRDVQEQPVIEIAFGVSRESISRLRA